MCHRWGLLLAGPMLLLCSGGTAPGKDRPAAALDRLLDPLFAVCTYKEVAISPDGKRVAWVETRYGGKPASPAHSSIYVADLRSPSAAPRRITAGDPKDTHDEHGLAWSPDGSRLVFLSDKAKKGQLQLYLAAATGGKAARLTDLKGALAQPRWAPAGKLLAFLFTENAPRAPGPVHPAAPDAGVVEEHIYEQRLTLLNPGTGRVRQLSPADLYVYEYDWSPDGKRLAAIAAPGSGDNNWYVARLYTLELATAAMTALWKPPLQIAIPRWSPDGNTIAFIAGLMSDEGVTGGDIYTIPARGGRPSHVTPGLQASASWLAWLPSGDILFTGHFDGSSGIATVAPARRRVATLWTGPETIAAEGGTFSLSLAGDAKTCALVRHSFRQPPEVWAGPIGAWKQVTRSNAGLRPAWGKAESLHWKSAPFQVQGWLLYPHRYDARRRYPLVVSIHGGPASARRPAWPGTSFDLAFLSGAEYFVFFPNPRGSFGRGEPFTRANVKDFGYGDLRDILAGVDEVVKTRPVAEDRLGVAGWSYGGYLTMWAVTQTGRFRAAVAGAGIANWQSYYGQNGIDQWLLPYFGASVYDDPAIYARSSPINFIKKVRTPTLVLVGDRDVECPAPQSYEFWRALKRLGVATRLVVYPHEGHLIARPENRRDIARRTAAWLGEYLRKGGAGRGGKSKGQ